MSQQDKPHAEISLDKVFSRIISEYESGNLEKINLQIDLGIKNPKYEKLEAALKEAVEALEDIAFRQSVSGEDKDGGPCRFAISDDRNKRILTAKYALERIRKVMG